MLLLDLGLREYGEVWELQKDLVEKRSRAEILDTLIAVEHPHVITIGRKGSNENVISSAVPIFHIERGGDATYHGPGQLVGYPIISLESNHLGVAQYVHALEDAIIEAIGKFGISGDKRSDHVGVWVNNKKIASIGVAVRHWVTFHGFALNVNTDLSYFNLIKPCGLEPSMITSMREILQQAVDFRTVKKEVCDRLAARLRQELVTAPSEELKLVQHLNKFL